MSVVVTIVGAIYNFSPKVSVVPDLNSEGPGFILFVLSNDSYLPIHDVEDFCSIQDIQPSRFIDRIEKPEMEANPDKMPGLGSMSIKPGPAFKRQTLKPNEKRSITCPIPGPVLKSPIYKCHY